MFVVRFELLEALPRARRRPGAARDEPALLLGRVPGPQGVLVPPRRTAPAGGERVTVERTRKALADLRGAVAVVVVSLGDDSWDRERTRRALRRALHGTLEAERAGPLGTQAGLFDGEGTGG